MEHRLAVYIKTDGIREKQGVSSFLHRLGGYHPYEVRSSGDLREGTDMLLSIGGDGTFLSAAGIVAGTEVPVCGINFGRLGFLSENSPEEVLAALKSGSFVIEDRDLLSVCVDGGESMYAFNEMTLHRNGAAMLGLDVRIGPSKLPTYWADGILVATSSGSTAYSLSVGGPICLPGSKVLIVSPIAPHNLNVRPLIIPSDSRLSISLQTRDENVMLTVDNRNMVINPEAVVEVSVAQFSLKIVRMSGSSFVNALTTKLFWGGDIRNGEK